MLSLSLSAPPPLSPPPPLGFTAELERVPTPSLFGNDIIYALFTAEYQTSSRFRFKVGFVAPREPISAPGSALSPYALHRCMGAALFPMQGSWDTMGRPIYIRRRTRDWVTSFHKSGNTGSRMRSASHWGRCGSENILWFYKEEVLRELSLLFFFQQITDRNNKRYEVPHENINLFNRTADTSNLNYHIKVTEKPFSIKIIRTSSNRVL